MNGYRARALPTFEDCPALSQPWREMARSYILGLLHNSEETAYNYGMQLRRFFLATNPERCSTYGIRVYVFGPTTTGRPPAPQTIICRFQPLRNLYQLAIEAGLRADDPTKGIEMPRIPARPLRGLTPDEMVRFVDAIGHAAREKTDRDAEAREARNRAMVWTVLYTGLRRAEVVTLTAGHLQRGMPSRGGGRWIQIRVKGGDVVSCHLPARLLELIDRALEARGARLETLRSDANLWGGLARYTLDAIFRQISRVSGVSATPHTARHSFAQFLIEGGESEPARSLPQVSRLLNHRSIATTHAYMGQLLLPTADHHLVIEDIIGTPDRLRKGPRAMPAKRGARRSRAV